jgi:hypothetical protein
MLRGCTEFLRGEGKLARGNKKWSRIGGDSVTGYIGGKIYNCQSHGRNSPGFDPPTH